MAKTKKQPKLSATALAQLKVKELQKLLPGGVLENGSHDVNDNGTPAGVCLMEAVAWVSGEDHSDHPACACPVLTEIGITINDHTDTAGRQRLIPAIPALVGSVSGSKKTYFKRARKATELALREYITELDDDTSFDSLGERLAVEKLRKIAPDGKLRNGSIATAVAEILTYLREESTGDPDEVLTDLVQGLSEVWDVDGIAYTDYSSLLEDVDFTHLIKDRDLPAFFVEVATQRAY